MWIIIELPFASLRLFLSHQ
jgi:hypothetical protein